MKDLNYGDGYLYNPAFACATFRSLLNRVLSRVGAGAGIRFTRNTRHHWFMGRIYYYLKAQARSGMRNSCCIGSIERTKDGSGRGVRSHGKRREEKRIGIVVGHSFLISFERPTDPLGPVGPRIVLIQEGGTRVPLTREHKLSMRIRRNWKPEAPTEDRRVDLWQAIG